MEENTDSNIVKAGGRGWGAGRGAGGETVTGSNLPDVSLKAPAKEIPKFLFCLPKSSLTNRNSLQPGACAPLKRGQRKAKPVGQGPGGGGRYLNCFFPSDYLGQPFEKMVLFAREIL